MSNVFQEVYRTDGHNSSLKPYKKSFCQFISKASLYICIVMEMDGMTDSEIRQCDLRYAYLNPKSRNYCWGTAHWNGWALSQMFEEQLIALGENVGPVTPSTRAIHLKKLRNLLAQGDGSVIEHVSIPTITNGNGVHLDIVNGEPTVEVERSSNHHIVSNIISESFHAPDPPQPRSEPPPAIDDGSDGEMRGEESVRYLSPEEMELEMSYSRRNCNGSYRSPNSDFRKVLLVVLLMVMVVFVFFLSDRLHRQTTDSAADEDL
uniref:LEM domain-containing protein n=1 Tax=Angiostrongylus cantonensis TaxID=6313 RepID=A0A0K0DGQ3_ANGCA